MARRSRGSSSKTKTADSDALCELSKLLPESVSSPVTDPGEVLLQSISYLRHLMLETQKAEDDLKKLRKHTSVLEERHGPLPTTDFANDMPSTLSCSITNAIEMPSDGHSDPGAHVSDSLHVSVDSAAIECVSALLEFSASPRTHRDTPTDDDFSATASNSNSDAAVTPSPSECSAKGMCSTRFEEKGGDSTHMGGALAAGYGPGAPPEPSPCPLESTERDTSVVDVVESRKRPYCDDVRTADVHDSYKRTARPNIRKVCTVFPPKMRNEFESERVIRDALLRQRSNGSRFSETSNNLVDPLHVHGAMELPSVSRESPTSPEVLAYLSTISHPVVPKNRAKQTGSATSMMDRIRAHRDRALSKSNPRPASRVPPVPPNCAPLISIAYEDEPSYCSRNRVSTSGADVVKKWPCLSCGANALYAAIQCIRCDRWCHMKCAGVTSQEVDKFTKVSVGVTDRIYWKCLVCTPLQMIAGKPVIRVSGVAAQEKKCS